MVREKLLAYAAQQFLVIVDSGKIVSRLGTAFPLPVEALTMAWRIVQKGLQDLGGICTLREAAGKDGPVVTDQGNFILDTVFPATVNWVDLDTPIMRIPGVVGHGLFTAFTDKSTILVGDDKGVSVL